MGGARREGGRERRGEGDREQAITFARGSKATCRDQLTPARLEISLPMLPLKPWRAREVRDESSLERTEDAHHRRAMVNLSKPRSSIHSVKHLLQAYYVLNTVPGSRDIKPGAKGEGG